jgi:Glycosyl transferase family 2
VAVAPVTWDILICSLPHRLMSLAQLLARLNIQMRPGVGVRVFRDNQEFSYGQKCQALLETSEADYVCFIDDDDMVPENYVSAILGKLYQYEPDYVGFKVAYFVDGHRVPVEIDHSLVYDGWHDYPGKLVRDIVHFNPIKREIALLGRWDVPGWDGWGADRSWSDQVRQKWLGPESTEVPMQAYVPECMYFKQDSSLGDFRATPSPEPDDSRMALPLTAYSWLSELRPGPRP